ADGHRAGRGARSGGRRRRRLHEDDPRPAARRRDLSPHRRRLPRSPRLPTRFDARRPGADRRVSRAQRRAGERGRQRRRRRQGGVRPRAHLHPLLPRRGADPAQRRDPPVPPARRSDLRPRAPARAGGEAGRRVGRLRTAHGPDGRSCHAGRVPRPPARRPAQLHRAAAGRPVARAVLGRGRRPSGRAPRGPPALLPVRRRPRDDRARWAHARRAARGVDGGELLAGRRQQGHLGPAGRGLMLSRIADSLFWMARYMERAEDTARILDVNYYMMLEGAHQPYRLRWEPLVIISGAHERFFAQYDEAVPRSVFEFLGFSQDNPDSIVECVSKARENARTIRDRISREMWEDVNGLYLEVSRFRVDDVLASGPHAFCDLVKSGSHRFRGVSRATFPRDEGWHFLNGGQVLERAEMTARIVDVQYHTLVEGLPSLSDPDNHQWMAVLKSVAAYEFYRRTYNTRIEPERVA